MQGRRPIWDGWAAQGGLWMREEFPEPLSQIGQFVSAAQPSCGRFASTARRSFSCARIRLRLRLTSESLDMRASTGPQHGAVPGGGAGNCHVLVSRRALTVQSGQDRHPQAACVGLRWAVRKRPGLMDGDATRHHQAGQRIHDVISPDDASMPAIA